MQQVALLDGFGFDLLSSFEDGFGPAEIACRGTGKLLINEPALDRLQALRDRLGKRRLAGLAITTSLLSGCATVRSEDDRLGTCPPVVEYVRELQARAAEELTLLPEASVVAEMLADYAVMRDQARSRQ